MRSSDLVSSNELTIGWQKLNPLSHPNATLAPQARQARASGEKFERLTLAPQARPSGEILNYLLSRYSDILKYDHWVQETMHHQNLSHEQQKERVKEYSGVLQLANTGGDKLLKCTQDCCLKCCTEC